MMTMRFRLLMSFILVLATTWLSGCGHYNCGATFGNATCNASGGGLGGGGNTSNAAYAYYIGTGVVGGVQLDTAQTFSAIPNFGTISLPTYTVGDITVVSKKFLYLPYANGLNLYGWSIASSGALTPLSGSPLSAFWAAGLPTAAQPLSSIISSPDGSLLFGADQADSLIAVYKVDATTGALTAVAGSPFSTVVEPWNLATDGLGKYLYVTQGNVGGEGVGMAVYTINSSTGALSNGTVLPYAMWQVAGEPTGNFLVGVDGLTGQTQSGIIDPNLYVFSINPGSGVATQIAQVATTSLNGPTRVVVSPNGKFVYDFNINASTNFDGPVDGYSWDSLGTLTPLSGSPFSGLSIPYGGKFDESGSYLFFRSHAHIGAWTIDPTTGFPTELTSGQNAVSDLPWVVTDAQ